MIRDCATCGNESCARSGHQGRPVEEDCWEERTRFDLSDDDEKADLQLRVEALEAAVCEVHATLAKFVGEGQR